MAKKRVYELARDFNMTNKVLLEKMEAMGVVVKSHMSALDAETEDRIKKSIFGDKKTEQKIEVKRVKSTVIRRRRKPDPVKEVPEPEEEELPEELPDEEPTEKATEKEAEKPPKKTAVKKAAKKTAEEIAEQPAKAEKKEAPKKVEDKKAKEDEKKVAKTPQAKDLKKKEAGKKVTTKVRKRKKHIAAKIIKLPEKPVESPAIKEADVDKHDQVQLAGITPVPEGPPPVSPPKEEQPKKEIKKHKKKKKRGEADKQEELEDGKKFFKKKISFRKKSVVEGDALYGGDRTRGRKARRGAKVKAPVGEKTQITTPKAIKRRIKIDDTVVLSNLAKRMGIKAGEMIQKLMAMGVMATVNQTIDYDTAVLVAGEFEYEVERASFEEDVVIKTEQDDPSTLVTKPPVVTIMGHVDHGKTSLLDVIRSTNVTGMEAGGITQHIGAYNVNTDRGRIVFLDTPGHEAFTAMRARGAVVTDIVVLVVAADDGVMPQTIEAINHSKAAKVPIIVAVNKIDKEDADPERVKRGLSEHGIVAEDWGGDTIFVNVSAKQKKGLNTLLDMIMLQTEMLELKANPEKFARGYVIEAKLDTGRGAVATVLVQEGTLKTGDYVVCGVHFGKVRALVNDMGQVVEKAGPSVPVEVLGLGGVPEAGDELVSIEEEKHAKQVSVHRIHKHRAKQLAKSSRLSLEGLFEKLGAGEVKDLNLIIKADVHGSIEALSDSLTKLSGDEVKINVIHSATGGVTESDVSLAMVSNAIIIGFNVRPGSKVMEMASEENVDMRFYDIIYNAIKDVKDAMVGMMSSTFEEHILGRAEVREVFVIPKKGSIAGSYVTDGKIERGEHARLLRDSVVVYDGIVSSLRRFKDDAKEVQNGFECGIGIENFNDIKVNDMIECYHLEEIRPTME